jgi:hypothetical protein
LNFSVFFLELNAHFRNTKHSKVYVLIPRFSIRRDRKTPNTSRKSMLFNFLSFSTYFILTLLTSTNNTYNKSCNAIQIFFTHWVTLIFITSVHKKKYDKHEGMNTRDLFFFCSVQSFYYFLMLFHSPIERFSLFCC